MDHSIRAKTQRHDKVIASKHLLPAGRLSAYIKYPTHHTSTGWDVRQLSNPELHGMYGFPSKGPSSLTGRVPLQMLEALIDPVCRRDTSPREQLSTLHYSPPSYVEPVEGIWMPKISRMLPHTWRSDVVSTVSTKADTASVPMHMWNSRVTTIFPSFSPYILDRLRNLVLRRAKRMFRKEIILYLMDIYPHFAEQYSIARYKRYAVGDTLCVNGGGWSRFTMPHFKGQGHKLFNTASGTRDEETCDAFRRDLVVAREVLTSYAGSTYFNWDHGSQLVFWRWPEVLRKVVRDGMKPYYIHHLPHNMAKARPPPPDRRHQIWEKFDTALRKGYLKLQPMAEVKNFIDSFHIPKGEDDIRMVLNGTSCGVNKALFASNFWLPYSSTMTRVLHYGYKVVDLDIGECFLNFNLHADLVPYSGIDLTHFRSEIQKQFPEYKDCLKEKRIAATFNRMWFGNRQSPKVCVQYYYLAEEVARGDPSDHNNRLRYDEVKINAPGSPGFNPALPYVYKWDALNMRIAGEILAYVDDLRAIGYSWEEAWRIARQVASRFQMLGVQDAARKRRLANGPWAGGMFSTEHGKITKTVTSVKWLKGKQMLDELTSLKAKTHLSYKRMEQIRGFFCHLCMVFDTLTPYLKGFHLALASYLPQRDDEGWKFTSVEFVAHVENKVADGEYTREQAQCLLSADKQTELAPPAVIEVDEYLWECIESLKYLMRSDTPPEVVVRTEKAILLIYGYADASGSGFGESLLIKGHVHYRIGTWATEEQTNSSNWREFENVVSGMEDAGHKGWLRGASVLLATDNSVVERALYKGNSTSKKLFKLVLRFKSLELEYGCKILVTHVAGTRMISQGTDGISRGRLNQGVGV